MPSGLNPFLNKSKFCLSWKTDLTLELGASGEMVGATADTGQWRINPGAGALVACPQSPRRGTVCCWGHRESVCGASIHDTDIVGTSLQPVSPSWFMQKQPCPIDEPTSMAGLRRHPQLLWNDSDLPSVLLFLLQLLHLSSLNYFEKLSYNSCSQLIST